MESAGSSPHSQELATFVYSQVNPLFDFAIYPSIGDWVWEVLHLVEVVRHETGGSVFDSGCRPRKYSSDLIPVSAISSAGVHSVCNINQYQAVFLEVNCSRGVLVVPNVRVMTEAPHSIPLGVPLTCYGRSFAARSSSCSLTLSVSLLTKYHVYISPVPYTVHLTCHTQPILPYLVTLIIFHGDRQSCRSHFTIWNTNFVKDHICFGILSLRGPGVA